MIREGDEFELTLLSVNNMLYKRRGLFQYTIIPRRIHFIFIYVCLPKC